MPAEYYSNVIYPLQDRAIPVFRDLPFYLTGGTALSRGYFNHRYSDDLDYFLNADPRFNGYVDRALEALRVAFGDLRIPLRDRDFCRLLVSENRLKIELINDVPAHVGAIVEHPLLGRIDSKKNILANKITAIADRALPKDIVDVFFLLKDGLSLRDALTSADGKAAGIAPLYVAKLFADFDYSLLDTEIKWGVPLSGATVGDFMRSVAHSIVKGTI